MTTLPTRITQLRPRVFGALYLALIPLFAVAYTHWPGALIHCTSEPCGMLQAMYYSIVTITTLGYGDITPSNPTTQVIAALEAVSGVLVIGLFLNSLSHRLATESQEAEKEKEQERRYRGIVGRLRSHNAVIEAHIERCLLYSFEVTVPLATRGEVRDAAKGTPEVNPDFAFADMKDLFRPSMLMSDSHSKPVVAYFFDAQYELISAVHALVLGVDLSRWQALEAECIAFMSACKRLDYSEHILEQPTTRLGDKTGAAFAAELIAAHTGLVEFKHSNVINAYVALYHLIKLTIIFIESYRAKVGVLLSGSAP